MRAVFLPRTQEGDSTLPENNPKCNDCFLSERGRDGVNSLIHVLVRSRWHRLSGLSLRSFVCACAAKIWVLFLASKMEMLSKGRCPAILTLQPRNQ
jgi:hypothetical protein